MAEMTPGRAAYEAVFPDAPPGAYAALAPESRERWEAGAQAAVDESDSTALAQLAMAQDAISDLAAERKQLRERLIKEGKLPADAAPPAIIHFDGELSDADVAQLRENFAKAVRTERPRLLDEPAPELAAAMAETRHLRADLHTLADLWTASADNADADALRPNRERLLFRIRADTYRKCAADIRKLAGPKRSEPPS